MTDKYLPGEFEKKWIDVWEKEKLYRFKIEEDKPHFAKASRGKEKYYVLVELPYTSGDLHVGHWFAFAVPDVLARFKRMSGFNVFYPNGYDAFGLPAENAAIKHKVHPQDWTMKNIETMTKQFFTMGTMIDWSYLVVTCLPKFYRWNQWIFLKMYEKGLIYRGKILSNWCPSCQTVLANENVVSGRCWRCDSQVVQKEVDQWFIKITDYADQLIWPDKPTVDWPNSVRVGQNNWIGRSEGVLIDFDGIEVFTTRPETIDGASFIVLAPEHSFVNKILNSKPEIKEYVQKSISKSEMERKENREKTGVFSGVYVNNPVTGKKVPVWIADYVLVGYGTGAIMAVPAEDKRDREFAEKFNLPIIKTSLKAKPKGEKKSIYHIRDWSISRQRYWGTPVPMIHCKKCGIVPVPEKDLPIELPYEVDFTPQGKPPLASNEKWLRVDCPVCGVKAERDAETLDTFFDSSWYWFRYLNPHYDRLPFDKLMARKLTPVDIYFGGAEHTLGHTLYARFFTRFFKDINLVDYDEFALKRVQHGIVLGPDGNKMSKSKGNVINPDDVVKEYGADTVRLYLCFIMPYEGTGPWSDQTIAGVNRFLTRIWHIYQQYNNVTPLRPAQLDSAGQAMKQCGNENPQLISKLNKTIDKVTKDLGNIKMNTAIAGMIEFLNAWEESMQGKSQKLKAKNTSQNAKVDNNVLSISNVKKFLQILAPFAPFISEEIWRNIFKEKQSIHLSSWPKADPDSIGAGEDIIIPVQVNGKLRNTLRVFSHEILKEEVEKIALADEKVKKYLTGKKYRVIYVQGKIINFIVE